MLRILVSAYGCEPEKGSEQGVGWHWVLEMARSHQLWVLTRTNNRSAIEAALPPQFVERITFIYYDLPSRWRRLKRREKGLYVYYAFWQWGAYRLARGLAERIQFDYCQHLTFGSMWMPTFFYKLPIPFIWGPIGGGECVPFCGVSTLPWRGRIAEYGRRLLIRLAFLNPLFFPPARAARAIITRTEDSRAVFPSKMQSRIWTILETGIGEAQLKAYHAPRAHATVDHVRLIYTGRLVAVKNVSMAINAFAAACEEWPAMQFDIVGDGPLRRDLGALVRKLGVGDRVIFHGAVSHDMVLRTLEASDIFLFPSLKEGGSWSLMEAMAAGLPVICLDTTGMHLITDEASAIRVSPNTVREMTRQMTAAIVRLARSPEERRVMGAHAQHRLQDEFQWGRKGEFMTKLLKGLGRDNAAGTAE